MPSDAQLTIRSDPDVQITIYDRDGAQRLAGRTRVAGTLPRGRYRVHLDRCDFTTEHWLKHPSDDGYLPGPAVDSPAPIAIARDASAHARVAAEISAKDTTARFPLAGDEPDARLLVFVRRIVRGVPAPVPSEPVSLHDMAGRQLIRLGTGNADHDADPDTGYMALSCRVAPGTYRLRVGWVRRDLAITIPAGRAAQVFLADRGAVSLRTSRVYLPRIGEPFDAASEIAGAMESVLWALGRPRGELPESARALLEALKFAPSIGSERALPPDSESDGPPDRRELARSREAAPSSGARDAIVAAVARDPIFGIACAHLARRQGRDATLFDRIMSALNEHAPDLPDVVILERTRRGRSSLQAELATPPLLRASMALALAERIPVVWPSAFSQVAVARHDDSVWCTWSPRWWDERWVEPTAAQLRSRRHAPDLLPAEIAAGMRLPEPVVVHAVARLDASLPAGKPISATQIEIPECTLEDFLGRGDRSTVFRAHRKAPGIDQRVAIKIMPVAHGHAERIAAEIQAAPRWRHERIVGVDRSGALADGSAVWLETELCHESLFAQLARRAGPLPLDEACELVRHALEGLEALHVAGIVHGRVHPGNLLIRTDGRVALALPGYVPADPAVAAASKLDGDAVRFTAPEAVSDPARATAASDVWSMAATLYFLITLELPRERYTGQTEQDAAARNATISLADRLVDAPQPLVACLERALSSSVDRERDDGRYATARELREALSQAVRPELTALRATRLYDELVARDAAFAGTFRNVFLRMTEMVGDKVVGRPVRDNELEYADAAENDRVQLVLERFCGAGLLLRRRDERGASAGAPGGPPTTRGGVASQVALREWFESATELMSWRRLRDWNRELEADPEARGALLLICNAVRSLQAYAFGGPRRDGGSLTLGERIRRWYDESQLLWPGELLAIGWRIQRTCRVQFNKLEHAFLRRSRFHLNVRRAPMVIAVALVMISFVGLDRDRGNAIGRVAASRTDLNVARSEVRSARDEVRFLGRSLRDRGRELLLDGHPFKAIPYLVAAGKAGPVEPSLQMLFQEAIRNLSLQHDDAVLRAEFSPDGSRLVTASRDGTAQIWDTRLGERIVSLRQPGAVVSVAWSPDGTRLVTGSEGSEDSDGKRSRRSEGGTAQIWDAATGKPIGGALKHDNFVTTVQFSPEGAEVLTASLDGVVRIWNAKTGAVVQRLQHAGAVWSAVFSPDGARVVTASRDRAARIWDAKTGVLRQTLGHRAVVWSAEWSPDGERVATASQDGTAQIWNATTGKPVAQPLKHDDGVTVAAFDRSGKFLVTASHDRTARVWNALTGEAVTRPLEHRGSVTSVAFSPDGTRVVTGSRDGTARIWDARTGCVLHSVLEHEAPVHTAMFSPDGARVATASDDGTGRVWSITSDLPAVALANDGAVRYAAFSPDGRRVVTASDDNVARIWDTTTGEAAGPALAHDATVKIVGFSSDGARVVTASERTVRVWDAATGKLLKSFPHSESVIGATFSPDGKRIVTAMGNSALHRDDTVLIWDMARAQVLVSLGPPDRIGIVSALLSSDDTHLATVDRDGNARITDGLTGISSTLLLDHKGVTSVAFSPSGARVITAGREGQHYTARVWSAATGEQIAPSLEHAEPVTSASFAPDGERVVTISGGTACVWDAVTGKPLTQSLVQGAPIVSAAFTEDGARLMTADSHAVRAWDVALNKRPIQEWSKIADRSPYVIQDGVLMLRSIAANANPTVLRRPFRPPS